MRRRYSYRRILFSLTLFAAFPAVLCAQLADEAGGVLGQPQSSPVVQTTVAANAEPSRNLRYYEESIRPLLRQACFDCHSGDEVEGNFRIDQLNPDFINGEDIDWWLEAYSVIGKGEMPPPESSELTDVQRTRIVNWLSKQIQAAEQHRKRNGKPSSFRRLTRYEYSYALQDLLGVPWSFANDLPAEASAEGAFENNAGSLHMSVKQVEAYHELALRALRRVTVRGDRPPMVYWAIPMQHAFEREKQRYDREIASIKKEWREMPEKQVEQIERLNRQFQAPADRSHYLEQPSGRRVKMDWHYGKAIHAFKHRDTPQAMPADLGNHIAAVLPGNRDALTVELGDRLPNAGTMRVRIRASRADGAEHRVPSLQLHFGFQSTNEGRSIERIGGLDVPIHAAFGQPQIYEWDIPLSEIEHRNSYRGQMKLGEQPSPSEYIRFTNSTVETASQTNESPAVLIDYVEVVAPVYEDWPPKSHRSVFVPSGNSDDEIAYAREIITNFLSYAWRRTPSIRDIARKLELFRELRASSNDFQEAIVEVVAAILSSPKFLYVLPGRQDTAERLPANRLSPHELATRLSLFLWCSLPDETLLNLASTGRLHDQEVLQRQVDRMLADPRAARFAKHFVGQWLKMQPLEYLRPSRGKDGLDEALLESIKEEPIALFAHMLQHNANVLEFIDANYVVVNERLADHYGIPKVQGNHFRRVELHPDGNRGGLLTQAGLLTMNSDGKDSHPVKRGVWLLTNLLNDPPPPPPPAVPEIDLSDPEIAKLTLKQRIEDHRNHAACLSCHQKIDPWGIAFENYDAQGRWRERIGSQMIDATSVLPGGFQLEGMQGLKTHLLQDRREQLVRATVEKMASFALGRQLDFDDRAGVTEVVERMRVKGDGITTMVMCLVTSDLFLAN